MSFSKSRERDRLIMSMEELTALSDEMDFSFEYVEPRDAFFDQPLHKFVVDEVRSMLRIFFLQTPCCISWYNPIYVVLFCTLFVLTLPGALLHWLVICVVPVRVSEDLEEREFRCQGIYTAIGTATFSMLYSVIAVYYSAEDGDQQMATIHTITLYVDVGIIAFCLIGLKGITDELGTTVRIFVLGAWVIDCVLVSLLLCGLKQLSTLQVQVIAEFALKLLIVFISTVVATQSMHFWDMYEVRRSRKAPVDNCLAGTLLLITAGNVVGLGIVVWLTFERGLSPTPQLVI